MRQIFSARDRHPRHHPASYGVLLRIIPFAIALFWLVMITLLGRQLIFPPEMGGRTWPARQIIRNFLNQEETLTTLQVYRGTEYLGDANIVTRIVPPPLGSLGKGTSEIILTSNLVTKIPGIAAVQDISLSASAKLRDLDVVEVFVANVRLPLLDFEARGTLNSAEEEPSFRATIADEVVLSSDPTEGPTLADLPMAKTLGLDPSSILTSVRSESAEGKMPAAREGSLPFAGRQRPVIMLPLKESSGKGRRALRGAPTLYFTLEGTLVKIVLGGGYELRSLQLAGES